MASYFKSTDICIELSELNISFEFQASAIIILYFRIFKIFTLSKNIFD